MIKWAGYGKLLKQLFFISSISCFILLGNSFVKADGFVPIGQLGFIENNYDTSYGNSVLKKGRFMTNYLGTTKALFGFGNQSFIFWNDGKLYLYDFLPSADRCSSHLVQGYFNKIRSCPVISSTGDFNIGNCAGGIDYSPEIVGNFLRTLNQGDWFYYDRSWVNEGYCRGFWYNTYFCFSSQELGNTLCFYVNHSPQGSAGGSEPFYGLGQSLGFNDGLTFGLINNIYLEEPVGFVAGENIDGGNQEINQLTLSGDVLYSQLTTGNAINYIESSRGFDKNICYVGTTDYDSLRGSSSSFNEGQGGTIFDLYNHYYGDYNNSPYGLQSVANFIESWVINYYQWFLTDGNPTRLAFYNSGSGLYSYRYENLTFPFENNPFAVYFMSSNIHGYVNYFGDSQDLQGSAVVDYCNLLLNGGTVEEMITPGLKQGFIENSERNQLAPGQAFDYSGMQYKVDGSSWNGVFDSSSGAVIVDGTNFINTFFNKVKGSVVKPDSSNNLGTLPTYILVFMCAIIFFRFIRR